jgi:DNA-binding CsgD family transcriptional regulator
MKNENLISLIIFLCFLIVPHRGTAQKTIIKNGDTWEYNDQGYLDNDWMLYLEKYQWKKGVTPIGYGDKKIATNISFGGDEEHKHTLKYFKKEIEITDNEFLGYEMRILRDDGALIYVNGKELLRNNMPNSTITKATLAIKTIDGVDESEYHIAVFENSIFKKGKNTISVSVHQAYLESSDCIFSLELIGHTSPEILSKLVKSKTVTNEQLKQTLKELNAKFEYEKVVLKNENLASTNSSLTISILIIIILFILSLVIIYLLLDSRKKKSIDKLKELLFLKEKILDKEKEMLVLSTKLLNNKQYFKEIKADVKSLQTEDKAGLKMIISDINEVLLKEDEWLSLKNHFEAVYEGFYDKLLTLQPDLTETELRHCMFIKLHLQTKEIARILLIDPRSVQTTRYRIKKKMNLNEDVDIRKYLLTI